MDEITLQNWKEKFKAEFDVYPMSNDIDDYIRFIETLLASLPIKKAFVPTDAVAQNDETKGTTTIKKDKEK